MEIVFPGSPDYDRLIERLRAEPFNLLCGSAVSIFAPTSLEAGASVTANLAKAIASMFENPRFEGLVAESAFESLLQYYPKPEHLTQLVEGYFLHHGLEGSAPVLPNEIHQAIVECFLRRGIGNIVTTNYDTCLESACYSQSVEPVDLIVEHDSTAFGGGVLFKIHGSADRAGTAALLMTDEQTLPDWKRDLLTRLSGGCLVVIGYSGLDFDICPELYRSPPQELVWIVLPRRDNDKEPDLTLNARKVLARAKSAYVVCGDLRRFLSDISDIDCRATGFAMAPLLSEVLIEALSESQMRLWSASVFDALSAPSAVIAIIEHEKTCSGSLSYAFELVRISALSRFGRYTDAADANARLEAVADLPLDRRIGHNISESGCASMGAFDDRAFAALDRARSLLEGLADGKQKIQLGIEIDWMTLLLECGRIKKDDRETAEHLATQLRSLYHRCTHAGMYGTAALCSAQLKEIAGEDARAVSIDEMERTAGDLFTQTGNYVGRVTALRDWLRRNIASPDAPAEAERLAAHIDDLILFGLEPELWRVYYMLIHFRGKREDRTELFRLMMESLERCQFAPAYVDSMRDAGLNAVEMPKGLHLTIEPVA